jgi:hypothetical protein
MKYKSCQQDRQLTQGVYVTPVPGPGEQGFVVGGVLLYNGRTLRPADATQQQEDAVW